MLQGNGVIDAVTMCTSVFDKHEPDHSAGDTDRPYSNF